MDQIPDTQDRTIPGYRQVLTHLKHAQRSADQLSDKATVTLIETVKHLCLNQARVNGELITPEDAPIIQRVPVASLSVHLFGTFQAFLNGTPIDGWRRKSESVFKYLVVHRTVPTHRDQLFELFWSDLDPQSARNCLNVTMHALRRCLQPNGTSDQKDTLIYLANDHYHFHPDLNVWTDMDMFTSYLALSQAALERGDRADALTHYEAAATMYRGNFLEHDCYEEWTIGYRERLQSAHIALLAQLSQLYFESGNYTTALERSLKALEYDGCNEEAHCHIMRCYYALGQRGLALRQYQICVDTLHRELNARPMHETNQLYEQIKNGSFRP
jgi:DNA-binding SARP family transcriptional activator